jgi:hypothetical protein
MTYSTFKQSKGRRLLNTRSSHSQTNHTTGQEYAAKSQRISPIVQWELYRIGWLSRAAATAACAPQYPESVFFPPNDPPMRTQMTLTSAAGLLSTDAILPWTAPPD